MAAFIAHLKKYRVFTIVFAVLFAISFFYFGYYPQIPFQYSWLLSAAIGAAVGAVIALLIAWFYDSAMPGTFHLAAPLYYTVPLVWWTFIMFASGDNIFLLLLFIGACIAGAMGVWLFFKRLWGKWGALVFHLAGNFLWFVFLVLFFINIHYAYTSC